jgi:hypothetical protein
MAGTTPLGTTVTVGTTTLSDILDVNYSGGTVELIDVTDLSDTTRSKLAGYVDTGSISVTANFDDATHDALVTLADGGSETCTVTFADTSTWSGSGTIDVAGFSVSSGSGVTTTFTIHMLSAWTFTAAS